MSKDEQISEEQLRQAFKKYLNPFMVTLFRLGLGNWFGVMPEISGNVMVLRHTGRKSGIRRHQPLNFAIVDGELYCTAGFGAKSDWYRNIIADPRVEVWLPDGWWEGTAEEVPDGPGRTGLLRAVLIGSGFAARVAGMDPAKMSDQEIEAAAAHYRLMRIRRTAARTGAGGPGDLAWIWPLAAMLLLAKGMGRRRR